MVRVTGCLLLLQEIVIFRGNCELSSRKVFLRFSSSAVGCTFPSTSVTRDTIVWGPGVGAAQAKVNNFQEYLLLPGSSVAFCQGPSSIFTSTDCSGVPSFRT